ncbi:hypothetical protein L204_103150 [Cryptococcus depauperatus]
MQVALSENDPHYTLEYSALLTPLFEPNTPPNERHPLDDRVEESRVDVELDLREPVSKLLRLGTQHAHVKAENTAGAASLVQGNLELKEYIKWLSVLWRIYDALELGLQEYSCHPVLAPTYDPTRLARAPALADDIAYLLTLLPASATSNAPTTFTDTASPEPANPLPPFPLLDFLFPIFNAPPPPLNRYLGHIRSLASSSITAPGLLAHAYVQYLGDLSGGQVIGARVRESYDLGESNRGTKFYEFDLQQGGDTADHESIVNLRKRLIEFKDWYRRGIDEGVGEDQKLKADMVEEANLAFAFNTDLFSIINVSEKPNLALQVNTQTPTDNKDFL